MLNIVEPNYSLQDLTTLEEIVKAWYTDTNDILVSEIGTDNQQFHDFNRHWQKSLGNLPYKSALKRRLQQAKSTSKTSLKLRRRTLLNRKMKSGLSFIL